MSPAAGVPPIVMVPEGATSAGSSSTASSVLPVPGQVEVSRMSAVTSFASGGRRGMGVGRNRGDHRAVQVAAGWRDRCPDCRRSRSRSLLSAQNRPGRVAGAAVAVT